MSFEPLSIRDLATACDTSRRKMRRYLAKVYPMPDGYSESERNTKRFVRTILAMDLEGEVLSSELCGYVFRHYPRVVPPLSVHGLEETNRPRTGEDVHARCEVVPLLGSQNLPLFTLIADASGFIVYNRNGPKFFEIDWADIDEAVEDGEGWVFTLSRSAQPDPFLRTLRVFEINDLNRLDEYLDDAGLEVGYD